MSACNKPPCEEVDPFRYCPVKGCGWMEEPPVRYCVGSFHPDGIDVDRDAQGIVLAQVEAEGVHLCRYHHDCLFGEVGGAV